MFSFNMSSIFNSVWVTIIMLGLLVVVHEFGHFITARFFGVTVYEFSVGFGPLIGKFQRKGIQYSFRWLLLGGYVKIAGMDNSLEGESPAQKSGELTFLDISLWKKIAIIAAGPLFNFILALLVFFGTITLMGAPIQDNSPTIGSVLQHSPAYQAGLQPGDRILAIGGNPVKTWGDIITLVQKHGKNPIEFQVLRHGAQKTLQITPTFDRQSNRYLVGIQNNPMPIFKKVPLHEAIQKTITLPGEIIKAISNIVTRKVKLELAGPIGMVKMVNQSMQYPFMLRIFEWLILMVEISISLFLFNILPLPLPLLDGGWIMILLLERLLRREFSAEQKATAQMIGLVTIIALAIFIGYHDILNFRK